MPAWKQYSFDIDCADTADCKENCKYYYNALYFEGKLEKKCYSYKVLENICMLVEFDEISGRFKYKGGCFKDNRYYTMKDATPGEIYELNEVKIEVRSNKDPIIYAAKLTNYSYNFGTSFVID